MFDSNHTSVNEKNHLTLGGCDSVELAKEYGTPLYVLDETVVRERCRFFVDSVKEYYGGNGLILYASKALSCMALYRIAKEEGMGVDVVSGGEMYTAYKAGFPMEKVYFHGNCKTPEELSMALDLGLGRIVVDSVTELRQLASIAKEKGKTANVLFRIKPGIDAHTHDFVKTGQIDCKFGLALETGEALEVIREAVETEHICYCGVHCHIGSQIFDIDPFCEAAHVMMRFIKEIKDTCGADTKELNLGGGFGIAYNEKDDPIPFGNYMEAVSRVVHEEAEALALPLPFILMEPGRSIVATAGSTLYTVGVVKDIPDVRTYVSVDGGMADNPRYILYQAEYHFTLANRAGDEKDAIVTVAGRCCESGDLLGENVRLQRPVPGDILAVSATGAYNYSMASHYNRLPNPAMVLVKDGTHRVIIKRESYEDIIRNDIF
ncbi:MAG: diaminopimelate decarboxylase [Clostridia bacterium]|nr:diaminopimelate decarboxylase [Clostridia bacterium]